MTHIFDSKQMHKLESPERKKMLPAEEILLLTGLKAGDVMADIGAGTGYFSFPASGIVGEHGKILAADISSDMLDFIRSKLTDENRDRIQLFNSDSHSCSIPDSAADYLLLSLVLHEAEDPLMMLNDLHRAIKLGGKIVIIEWIKKQMEQGPPEEHRIAMEIVSKLAIEASFTVITELLFNSSFYIVVAQK